MLSLSLRLRLTPCMAFASAHITWRVPWTLAWLWLRVGGLVRPTLVMSGSPSRRCWRSRVGWWRRAPSLLILGRLSALPILLLSLRSVRWLLGPGAGWAGLVGVAFMLLARPLSCQLQRARCPLIWWRLSVGSVLNSLLLLGGGRGRGPRRLPRRRVRRALGA